MRIGLKKKTERSNSQGSEIQMNNNQGNEINLSRRNASQLFLNFPHNEHSNDQK